MPIILVDTLSILIPVLCAIGGLVVGGLIIFFIPAFRKQRANNKSSKIIREAEIKAEHIAKNAQLDGKQAVIEMKNEAEKDIRERKNEVVQLEAKLSQREQSIDRREGALLSKEQSLDDKNANLERRLKDCDKKEAFYLLMDKEQFGKYWFKDTSDTSDPLSVTGIKYLSSIIIGKSQKDDGIFSIPQIVTFDYDHIGPMMHLEGVRIKENVKSTENRYKFLYNNGICIRW